MQKWYWRREVIYAICPSHESPPYGGKVSGVRLTDGTEVKSNIVASTVDPKQNFLEFFEESQLPADLVQSARRWEWKRCPISHASFPPVGAPIYRTEGIDDANRALMTHLGSAIPKKY